MKNLLGSCGISKIDAMVGNSPALSIDIEHSNDRFHLQGNQAFSFRDILWRAGIIPPSNDKMIKDEIKKLVGDSFKDNRQLALALDTSVLLLNQVSNYIEFIRMEFQRQHTLTRYPLILASHASQYELHHMISSDQGRPKNFPNGFVLPAKMYRPRGQRGKFGSFMLQTLMERYPLIIAKPGFPMVVFKPEDEVDSYKYSNFSPTSPVFDFLIVEQFTQLSKVTNLEVLFMTTDSNLSKIASQSGLKSIYLSHATPLAKKRDLNMRKVIWLIVSLLWFYEYVMIDGIGYCLVRNTNGSGSNLYFKKSDGSREYYELSVSDRLF